MGTNQRLDDKDIEICALTQLKTGRMGKHVLALDKPNFTSYYN